MSPTVLLVARREIVSRWQQKGYRISLGVTLLIAIVAVIIPSFFDGGSGAKSYDVGIATGSGDLAAALPLAAREQQVRIRLHRAPVAVARREVAAGAWDVAVLPGPKLLAHDDSSPATAFVQAAFVDATILARLRAAGLTAAQAVGALQVQQLPVHTTTSPQNAQRQTVAVITVIVLFSQLIAFCTWVATGVVEEKASRVVELLLSSVRPLQLLAGKLVGIGTLAAAQVALLAGAALIAATAAGTLTLPAAELVTVVISFVAFLLGFAFFAAVSAALGSTVSRQEEVSGVLAPVSVVLTLCYVAAFTVAADDGSTLGRVLSVVPPVSCIAMPARIARGGVPAGDVVLAVVLLLAATLGVLALAARIYRVSVLHTGTRLKLRDAWRGEAVAELN